MNDPTQYPNKFTPEELATAVRNEVAELIIDDVDGAHSVRFKDGPTYDAKSGDKLAFVNNAPQTEAGHADGSNAHGIGPDEPNGPNPDYQEQGDIGSVDGEGYGTDETDAGDVTELPGDEDEDDGLFGADGEDSEADFLETLDEVTLPPIITEEDLLAAGLENGPDYTHSEALLSTLAAANAAAPDYPFEPDLAEALYEFAHRDGWGQPETFYLHACHLANTAPGTFRDIDQEMRLWFIVFAHAGQALHTYATGRRTIYEGKMKQLAHELEKTRLSQKLADRKAHKQKRRIARGELRQRAAEKWRKKNETRTG